MNSPAGLRSPSARCAAFGLARRALLGYRFVSVPGPLILVVENEQLVALDIQQRLASLGYLVAVAASGDEAVERARESPPDLVLMDIKLNGHLDGIEAAHRIRITLDVPVVYLTAYADESTLIRARGTEPYGYMVKPFDERELKATIEMALRRHQNDRRSREQEEIQRFLADASARLAESLDSGTVLQRAAEILVPRHADWCLIRLKEADALPPLALAHPTPAGASTSGPVEDGPLVEEMLQASPWKARATAIVEPARVAERLGQSNVERLRAVGLSPEAMIAVPLVARARILGAIVLVAGRPLGRSAGSTELIVAEDFAHRLAVSIDNALLYREAQRASRMREDVLAVVSHDLRNALNVIVTQTQGFEQGAGDPRSIVEAARGMGRLIGDLLDSAAIDAGRLSLVREPNRVAPLVEEAIEALRPFASERGCSLSAALPSEPGFVVCDKDRVQQVLSNLIGNAIKFSPPGASITVRVEARGPAVCFSVSDDGPGISADRVPRLFERFWRAEGRAQGTGLGLYIARGIMEAHGESLWVESEVSRGATFSFMLPLAPSAREVRAPGS